ncbi:hypothetical protein PINS_up022801 [Pythium insidiosum]|nr:hypothetical protein PINS_up022801 [Pythium insidiosum]
MSDGGDMAVGDHNGVAAAATTTTPTAATATPAPAAVDASAAAAVAVSASNEPPAENSRRSSSGGAASASAGETDLAAMNSAFAKCLSLVCPPIQYPPHCRFNPVQQDAADMSEIEARLEEFFLHAKQLELLFLDESSAAVAASTELRQDLEMEILHLENELSEKNDLIEKYADVVRGWEGKFKRLDHRLTLERE